MVFARQYLVLVLAWKQWQELQLCHRKLVEHVLPGNGVVTVGAIVVAKTD